MENLLLILTVAAAVSVVVLEHPVKLVLPVMIA
jgi:hypothetical protein